MSEYDVNADREITQADQLDRVRQTIVFEAARLLHEGRESHVGRAKARASRSAFRGYIPPDQFPTDAEVASEIRRFESVEEPIGAGPNRWNHYMALLKPLERVDLPERTRTPGNALDHSLRVFQLVQQEIPYDEELLTAALLHEVGWAVDPWDHVAAGLDLLGQSVSDRTRWLIEHLPEANGRFDGTLGSRARNRLAASSDWAELTLLSDSDRRSSVIGDALPSVESAISSLQTLDGTDVGESGATE